MRKMNNLSFSAGEEQQPYVRGNSPTSFLPTSYTQKFGGRGNFFPSAQRSNRGGFPSRGGGQNRGSCQNRGAIWVRGGYSGRGGYQNEGAVDKSNDGEEGNGGNNKTVGNTKFYKPSDNWRRNSIRTREDILKSRELLKETPIPSDDNSGKGAGEVTHDGSFGGQFRNQFDQDRNDSRGNDWNRLRSDRSFEDHRIEGNFGNRDNSFHDHEQQSFRESNSGDFPGTWKK